MGRKLSCSDLGFACDAVFSGGNDDELLEQARQHAVLEHPEADLSDEDELRRLIRDES